MSALLSPPPPAPAPAPPARLTAEEFMARHGGSNAELIDGVVKEYPMPGFRHGKACMRLGALILAHVDANDLGHVASNDTWVRIGSEKVRGGDVLYYSYERLPKGQEIPEGAHTVAPDLVGEVKSPSDLWIDLFAKVIEYIKAGVRVVVVLDPAKSTVSIYRGDDQEILRVGDTLTLPDVLPGFSVPVARLFE